MSKNTNKYIRLPVHLACKTCPNGKVDCYIELTVEHPKGDLHNKCATCLSRNCALVKMDCEARMEIRNWLDAELRRRRDLADANPAFGRSAIAEVIEIDAGAAPRAGGKRTRSTGRDEDNIADNDAPATRTRSRNDAGAPDTSRSDDTAAQQSDFVRQAIELERASKTYGPQITKLQAEVRAAKGARIVAEEAVRDTQELEEKLEEKEEALDAALKREQAAMDRVKRAEKAESNALRQVNNIRTDSERYKWLWQETSDGKAGLEDRVRVAEASAVAAGRELEKVKNQLQSEREANAKVSREVFKWKEVARLAWRES